MKISELNTQSFLGGTNVPANSYVLINYADSANGTPVTKKVSVQELGKAIVNDQKLYKQDNDGNMVTTSVNNGAYVNSDPAPYVYMTESTTGEQTFYAGNTQIELGGGGSADMSAPIELINQDTQEDLSLFFCLSDGDGKFYDCSACGPAELFNTGGNYVVVYDSSYEKLGYYEPDSSEIVHLNLVENDPVIFNSYLVAYDSSSNSIGYFEYGSEEMTPITTTQTTLWDYPIVVTSGGATGYIEAGQSSMYPMPFVMFGSHGLEYDTGDGATEIGYPLVYADGSFGYFNGSSFVHVSGITAAQ